MNTRSTFPGMRKSDLVPSDQICNAAYAFELAWENAYASFDTASEKHDASLLLEGEEAWKRLMFTPSTNIADKEMKQKATLRFTNQRVDMGLGYFGFRSGSPSSDLINNPPDLDAAHRFALGECVTSHFDRPDVERDEHGNPIVQLPDDVYIDDAVDD